jgi:hypothetical protein
MTTISGAEAMVRLLPLHGVQHIFGLCGDTSLPFYDALYRLDHGVVSQKWRPPFSHRPSKGIAVHKQADHDVMHLR